MMCIYCFQKELTHVSWANVILGEKKRYLCQECIHSFLLLNFPLCQKCSIESDAEYCFDCKNWLQRSQNQDVLVKNYAVLKYNEFAQNYLAKWKYQGDYRLIDGIAEIILPYIKKHLKFIDHTYTIIPIPLSDERNVERAFNQAKLIAELFGKIDETIIFRENNEKQSKKTKQERINSKNNFKIKKKIKGKILLVDDIYTTGSTLRQAASLLRENGATEVISFTLIRG